MQACARHRMCGCQILPVCARQEGECGVCVADVAHLCRALHICHSDAQLAWASHICSAPCVCVPGTVWLSPVVAAHCVSG